MFGASVEVLELLAERERFDAALLQTVGWCATPGWCTSTNAPRRCSTPATSQPHTST
jgi:hypothetical protein